MRRLYMLGMSDPMKGDVGPCDHIECRERAGHRVTVSLDGLQLVGYACDRHEEAARDSWLSLASSLDEEEGEG